MRSLFLFALWGLHNLSEARTWKDLVDSAIYLSSAIDAGRLEGSLERDPFDFSQWTPPEGETSGDYPSEGIAGSPTIAPSARYEFIVGNGGCPAGTSLFEIRMHDTWGDGWDDTTLRILKTEKPFNESQYNNTYDVSRDDSNTTSTITGAQNMHQKPNLTEVFRGRLEYGADGIEYACLKGGVCYSVIVSGGLWASEIKWEVRKVVLGASKEERGKFFGLADAKGIAPAHCQFSVLAPGADQFECELTCGVAQKTAAPTSSPAASIVAGYPSVSPTGA